MSVGVTKTNRRLTWSWVPSLRKKRPTSDSTCIFFHCIQSALQMECLSFGCGQRCLQVADLFQQRVTVVQGPRNDFVKILEPLQLLNPSRLQLSHEVSAKFLHQRVTPLPCCTEEIRTWNVPQEAVPIGLQTSGKRRSSRYFRRSARSTAIPWPGGHGYFQGRRSFRASASPPLRPSGARLAPPLLSLMPGGLL